MLCKSVKQLKALLAQFFWRKRKNMIKTQIPLHPPPPSLPLTWSPLPKNKRAEGEHVLSLFLQEKFFFWEHKT